MHAAETRVWGVTHAEVGGYLLGLWGLPYPIVEAVANHHEPGRVPGKEFGVLAATHVAKALVHEHRGRAVESPLDTAYLTHLGVVDKLTEWRELAQKQMTVRT